MLATTDDIKRLEESLRTLYDKNREIEEKLLLLEGIIIREYEKHLLEYKSYPNFDDGGLT